MATAKIKCINGYDVEIHDSTDENNGSLQGYLNSAVRTEKLKAVFGEPLPGDGYKVEMQWVMRINGQICSIYDYKGSRWHIGGISKEVVHSIHDILGERYFG